MICMLLTKRYSDISKSGSARSVIEKIRDAYFPQNVQGGKENRVMDVVNENEDCEDIE